MQIQLKKISSNETTKLRENNGVAFLEYHALNQFSWLKNAFSTRLGGVSTQHYSSMNLSFTQGDNKENVLENFKRFGDAIGVLTEQMVYSHQTHTNHVMRVTKEHLGMGILRERSFSDIDGLVTNEAGVCLVTSYADCVPLYFVDPVHRAIGLSHSGWRGTVSDICQQTVQLMEREFGTKPTDLTACIGPSICMDCYEVSADVALQFANKYSKEECQDILLMKSNEKYQLNLHMANYYNMVHAGILPGNISLPDVCTCCNPQILHSHRASQGKRGGLCAFLEIME